MYLAVEEKNHLEDRLGSAQSAAFTSDHQLQSVQVISHRHIIVIIIVIVIVIYSVLFAVRTMVHCIVCVEKSLY